MNSEIDDVLLRDVHCILGLPFDRVNLAQSVDYVQNAVNDKRSLFVSTPNTNFAISTQSDPDFFQSVIDSDLSVADGMPLIWVAKLLRIPIPERVAGSTLFEELSGQEARQDKMKVFFFGGQDGVAEKAHKELNRNSASMESCGFYDPGFVTVDAMSSPDIIQHINAVKPDFLVVALGAKKGQQWIQQNRSQLDVYVISHLGAVINFVAGHVERAPKKWQKLGLEWLWRIREEPSLWSRYLFDGLSFVKLMIIKVIPLVCYDRWLKRKAEDQLPIKLDMELLECLVIQISGSINYSNIKSTKKIFTEALKNALEKNVEIDCGRISYIDSSVAALLLLFQRRLREQGRELILSKVSSRIQYLLYFYNVSHRFKLS